MKHAFLVSCLLFVLLAIKPIQAQEVAKQCYSNTPIIAAMFSIGEGGYVLGGEDFYAHDTGNVTLVYDGDLLIMVEAFFLGDVFDPEAQYAFLGAENKAGIEYGVTYEATRYPFSEPGVPGFSVEADSRGESELTAQFVVYTDYRGHLLIVFDKFKGYVRGAWLVTVAPENLIDC